MPCMSMSKRGDDQENLFVTYQHLRGPGHPFYQGLNKVLAAGGFDQFVEAACQKFYANRKGRPSIAPGVYFRCLLLGYFEGIGSERGIAWRLSDSLSLRDFVGIPSGEATPNHSSFSRIRGRIDQETHESVFTWVLGVVAEKGLLKGKTIGIDASTLEANAAMKSIVRRDDGRTYQEYIADLAKASGIESPTADDLARKDRKRKGRKTSNKDWCNPNDQDAHVTKMKDGRTHMGHKLEHAVDMDSGAIVAITVAGGTVGDTATIGTTIEKAAENLGVVTKNSSIKTRSTMASSIAEVVADKGYHSNDVVGFFGDAAIRTYIAEPKRGRRKWNCDLATRISIYGNRRRIRGDQGRRLMKKRGELIERSFAHSLVTGGARRAHLRGHDKILKRMTIHSAGFNLGIVMRKLFGFGKPRTLQGRSAAHFGAICALWWSLVTILRRYLPQVLNRSRQRQFSTSAGRRGQITRPARFSTGC